MNLSHIKGIRRPLKYETPGEFVESLPTFSTSLRSSVKVTVSYKILGIWNFYSKNNFKIQTCLFTKHESLQGDSPRVCINILKCSLHSLVTKGIRLVGFTTRAMVCESPTHYLIVSKFTSDPWRGGRDM